jgi:hypothetical protein
VYHSLFNEVISAGGGKFVATRLRLRESEICVKRLTTGKACYCDSLVIGTANDSVVAVSFYSIYIFVLFTAKVVNNFTICCHKAFPNKFPSFDAPSDVFSTFRLSEGMYKPDNK